MKNVKCKMFYLLKCCLIVNSVNIPNYNQIYSGNYVKTAFRHFYGCFICRKPALSKLTNIPN